jgi:hypothetical protein
MLHSHEILVTIMLRLPLLLWLYLLLWLWLRVRRAGGWRRRAWRAAGQIGPPCWSRSYALPVCTIMTTLVIQLQLVMVIAAALRHQHQQRVQAPLSKT